jgi:hypothetical protein
MEESQSKTYFGILYVRSKVVLYTELMNSQFWVVRKTAVCYLNFFYEVALFFACYVQQKWGDESIYKISVDVRERIETQIKVIITLTKKVISSSASQKSNFTHGFHGEQSDEGIVLIS